MPSLGGWEFVLLIGVLVLLFGARKLPEMARSIGQSARVFKGEMKGMKTDEKASEEQPATSPSPAAQPATAPSPPAQVPPAQLPVGTSSTTPSAPRGTPIVVAVEHRMVRPDVSS